MGYKRWTYTELNRTLAGELAAECGLDPMLCLLLTGRGIANAEQAADFLVGNELQADPFSYIDMDVAADRVQAAIDNGEHIAVYGDYDADGVTATVLLYSYLKSRGAYVQYRLPRRDVEGYGLHCESIDELAKQGVQLIITVDNGVAAVDEVAYAASLGVDVVVTDHHQPPAVLPAAVAVVDPHRSDCPGEYKDLAGVGVAFLLACALEGDSDRLFEEYGDLVAIGTLADVMPLTGDNRVLVRRGLQRLNREDGRLGLRCLREVCGADRALTATGVAFTVAPRINAAGRMSDPRTAAALLLSNDETEAGELAGEIHRLNTERQATEAAILQEVLPTLTDDAEALSRRVLVVWGHGWHHGVLGIIAARLLERFGKPCLVLNVENGIARGSARSLPGFSLYEALRACEDCLLGYGGHEQAAGLTVEAARLDEFRDRINRYAAETAPVMPVTELNIDCRLRPGQINTDMLMTLAALEPVGAGNPRPVFALLRMALERVEPVGNGKHLRLTLARDGAQVTAMKFSTEPAAFPYAVGDTVDVAVTLDRNEFRGKVSVSVIVKDMRYSDLPQDELLDAMARVDRVLRREAAEEAVPSREQTAQVYRFFRRQPYTGPVEALCYRLKSPDRPCAAVLIACRILREAGLLDWHDDGDTVTVRVRETAGKCDLSQTATARYLNSKEE